MKDVLLLYDASTKYGDELNNRWKDAIDMSIIAIQAVGNFHSNPVRAKITGKKPNRITVGTLTDIGSIPADVLDTLTEVYTLTDPIDYTILDSKVGYISTEVTMPPESDELELEDTSIQADDVMVDIVMDTLPTSPSQEDILQERLQDKISAYEELVKAKETIEQTVEDLTAQLKQLQENTEITTQKYETLQADYDHLLDTQALQSKTIKELTLSKTQLTETIERLKTDSQDLNHQADEIDNGRADLEVELLDLKEELQRLHQHKDDLQTRYDALIQSHTDLQEVKGTPDEINFEAYYIDLMQAYGVMSTTLIDLKQAHSSLTSVNTELTGRLATLETRLTSKDIEFEHLCETKNELRMTIEDMKVNAIVTELALTNSEKELKEWAAIVDDKNAEIYRLNAALKLTGDIETSNEYQTLLSENKEYDLALNELQDTVNKLRTDNTNLLSELNGIRAKTSTATTASHVNIGVLAKQPLVSKISKLGQAQTMSTKTNIHIIAGLTNETNTENLLLNLLKYTDQPYCFIDLAYTPTLDYYFKYTGRKDREGGVEVWLKDNVLLSDVLIPMDKHYYMYGSYVGINDSALLNIDWELKFRELNQLGIPVVINWGTTGSSIRDTLLNTWVGKVHVHLCAQGSDLSLRAAAMQLQRFNYSEEINFVAIDVLVDAPNKVLKLIHEKHRGGKQVLYFGSMATVELT